MTEGADSKRVVANLVVSTSTVEGCSTPELFFLSWGHGLVYGIAHVVVTCHNAQGVC